MTDLDRCDREIAAIQERAAREPDVWPAYLFVMGEMDWRLERAAIEASA